MVRSLDVHATLVAQYPVNGVDYSEAELPGFIGTARNDASLLRGPSYDQGSTTQCWVIPLFDRRIKGIHVYMEDEARLVHRVRCFSANWLSF